MLTDPSNFYVSFFAWFSKGRGEPESLFVHVHATLQEEGEEPEIVGISIGAHHVYWWAHHLFWKKKDCFSCEHTINFQNTPVLATPSPLFLLRPVCCFLATFLPLLCNLHFRTPHILFISCLTSKSTNPIIAWLSSELGRKSHAASNPVEDEMLKSFRDLFARSSIKFRRARILNLQRFHFFLIRTRQSGSLQSWIQFSISELSNPDQENQPME